MIGPGRFVEVHVDTPLDVAESRDIKGLYRKARSGQLSNFTGIDSPYEAPLETELRIDATLSTSDDEADQVIRTLHQLGLIDTDL